MAKILYITPFFNYPPRDGASHRSVKFFEKLYEKHDVVVLTYPHKSLEFYSNQSKGKYKIHKLPSIHKENIKLSFFKRLFSSELPGFASHDINCILESIDKLILEYGKFDIYYFATQLMGQIVLKKKWPGVYVIDLYDVYATHREGKILDVPIWRPFHWLFHIEALRVKNYEKKIFQLFDHILVTCLDDLHTIKSRVHNSSVYEIPNGVNFPQKKSRNLKSEIMLMVGNFEHSPNNAGILWFYNEVWQMVKNGLSYSKLILVGKIPQSLKTIFSDDKDIEITGLVSNLDPYYEKAGCVIIPIFHLSGMKLKLLEAMAYGIPIVSTPTGAIGFEDIDVITVASTPKSFAEAILSILTSHNKNEKELDRVRQLIKKKYTWDKIGGDLNNILDSLEENINDRASS